jgi:hypothetical protein
MARLAIDVQKVRGLRSTGMVALVVSVVAFGLLAGLKLAGGVQAAPAAPNKYYPPLLQNFGPAELKTQGGAAEFAIDMNYGGGEAGIPQLGRQDIIPAVWMRLLLPSGVTLLRGGTYRSHFSDYGWRTYFRTPPPKTNLRWQFVHGVPTWKVRKIAEGILPRVTFWLSGQPGQCFTVTARAMYRHKKHWIAIPHAPFQTAQGCLPGSTGTTTTTTG